MKNSFYFYCVLFPSFLFMFLKVFNGKKIKKCNNFFYPNKTFMGFPILSFFISTSQYKLIKKISQKVKKYN